jgi:hypothetical protein
MPKPRLSYEMDWVRNNKLAMGLGVVGLVLGAAIGASGSQDKTTTTTVATTETETQTQTQTVNAPAAVLKTTKAKVTAARGTLSDLRSRVSDERGTLRKLEAQVSGTRAAIRRGTFDGDGTFIVGKDIDPGTYRAAAREGCYWERESSLDTSSIDAILANDNANGPVVLQVQASDAAVKVAGCAKFHKIG